MVIMVVVVGQVGCGRGLRLLESGFSTNALPSDLLQLLAVGGRRHHDHGPVVDVMVVVMMMQVVEVVVVVMVKVRVWMMMVVVVMEIA